MDTVQFEKQGHVAYITLNRPERMNAANLQLIRDLVQAKREFEDDPDLWVAILTGSGRAFCAGADLRRNQNDPDAAHNPASLQEKLEKTLTRNYKPVIAAVNGHCYGRGLAFAMDCDIRIASDQAVFCFAEPRWNFAERWVPKLAATIPPATAMWMLATTREISAERAMQLGLVMDVVPHDKLMEEATEVAERVSTNGPLAVRAGLHLIHAMIEKKIDEMAPLAELLSMRVGSSEDSRSGEAQKAFAEKRKPIWRGR